MFKGKRGNWGDWKWVGVWITIVMISAAIVLGIMGLGNSEGEKVTRHKREVKRDFCLNRYGGIELNYTKGTTTSLTFDLCNVINCGGKNSSYRGYDIYLCNDAMVQMQCEVRGRADNSWCGSSWGDTVKYTRTWEPYQNKHWEEVDLQRDYSMSQNPLTLSITHWNNYPLKNRVKHQNVTVYVILGVDVTGTDPKGVVKINVRDPVEGKKESSQNQTKEVSNIDSNKQTKEIIEVDYTKMKPEDIIEKATGYGDNNLWLEWVITTAKEN
ncbi:MAG: hypothetical protein ACRC6N_01500, partial [Plesiomonas sp.]|uniref:hypothetical protein n=1 Tax=Plesiomonas sp. TaxID=2486279 RepID=UPI003F303876